MAAGGKRMTKKVQLDRLRDISKRRSIRQMPARPFAEDCQEAEVTPGER